MGQLHEPGPWLVDGRDECNATTGTRAPGVHNGRVARLAVVRGGQVDARRGGGAPTTAPSARGLDDGVGAGHGQDLPGLLQGKVLAPVGTRGRGWAGWVRGCGFGPHGVVAAGGLLLDDPLLVQERKGVQGLTVIGLGHGFAKTGDAGQPGHQQSGLGADVPSGRGLSATKSAIVKSKAPVVVAHGNTERGTSDRLTFTRGGKHPVDHHGSTIQLVTTRGMDPPSPHTILPSAAMCTRGYVHTGRRCLLSSSHGLLTTRVRVGSLV